MITRCVVWERMEARLRRRERLNYPQARRLFNALHAEARALHVWPNPDRLEGLETDLRLAAALHALARR